jgi:hypothetical protein
VSFVAGSFAALLLGLSFLDENLLEVPMAGRNLVWWLALTGILLTIRSVSTVRVHADACVLTRISPKRTDKHAGVL